MTVDRYSRQVLFGPIGPAGQARLAKSAALLVGCGALGSAVANSLVRAGIGRLRIVDRDFVEWNNLQRQVLFEEEDARESAPKAAAAAERLRRINAAVTIEPRIEDLRPGNVEAMAEDVDLVLDGTDNFETRFLLNDVCVKQGKPWVYGGCVGSYGMVLPIVPGESACLACWLAEPPGPGSTPTCDTAGVLNTIVGVVAALQANAALKILTGNRGALTCALTIVDLWSDAFQRMKIERQPACPACGKRIFRHLDRRETGGAAVLCGRNAVQVTPSGGRVDLDELERRLASLGSVRRNEFLLRFEGEGIALTVFPDARAIVQGTDDPAKARTLYARYVGT